MYEVKADVYSDEAFEALRAKAEAWQPGRGCFGKVPWADKENAFWRQWLLYSGYGNKKVYELLKERDIIVFRVLCG